jgi:large subunit ribosomal protein L33
MAASGRGNRVLVKLRSTESAHVYTTTKSRATPERMEVRKYDPVLRRHVVYRETR